MIYLLTAISFTPGGSSTVHIYTQTIHRTTQLTTLVRRLCGIRTQKSQTNWEECGPCPVFASYTLTFVSQLRKKHGETSVRVANTSVRLRKPQSQYRLPNTHTLQSPHKYTHYKTHSYTHLQNNIKPLQYKLKRNAYRRVPSF